jgi:hypothetical protein
VKRAVMLLLLVASTAGTAFGHKPSDSYLRLGEPRVDAGSTVIPVRWDVALRDLDRVVELDPDHDGKVTWAEVRGADDDIRKILGASLHGKMSGHDCTTGVDASPRVVEHSDGMYVVYNLTLSCAATAPQLELTYSLFFDSDPQHRGLLRANDGNELIVFARQAMLHDVPLSTRPRHGHFLSAIAQGIHHIWTGYDHMLFLIALLLPSVLRRRDGTWVPVDKLRDALLDVLSVVTAFTVAHSITLSAAALGVLALPSRLVESAIALSVVLAALNNLWPLVRADRWLAAFSLGLLHGFGFSSTLADLGLTRAALVPTLLGFNVGVEIGQATIVAIFVPLAFAARRTRAYRVVFLTVGSVVITLVAALWLYERATGTLIISGP